MCKTHKKKHRHSNKAIGDSTQQRQQGNWQIIGPHAVWPKAEEKQYVVEHNYSFDVPRPASFKTTNTIACNTFEATDRKPMSDRQQAIGYTVGHRENGQHGVRAMGNSATGRQATGQLAAGYTRLKQYGNKHWGNRLGNRHQTKTNGNCVLSSFRQSNATILPILPDFQPG